MIKRMSRVLLIVVCILFVCVGFSYRYEDNENNMSSTINKIDETSDFHTTEIIVEKKYTDEELDLLSRVVYAEAGSNWLTDEHQKAVASVVINRKNDNRFPNTIKEVVYQKGQYGCVYNGMINQPPDQRAYDNAKYVLENGVTIPSDVVWQAQFKQGKGLYKYIQGHYFCY